MFPRRVYALQLQTSGADTATLVRLIPGLANLPYTWGGTATGCVQITGPHGALHVIGHVHGPSLSASFGHYTELRRRFCLCRSCGDHYQPDRARLRGQISR